MTGRDVWETPHGVKMRFPTDSRQYFRLDYVLRGQRQQPNAGKDQDAAWAKAMRADLLLAAERGDVGGFAASELYRAWVADRGETWSARYQEMTEDLAVRIVLPVLETVAVSDLCRADLRACMDACPNGSNGPQVYTLLSSMVRWGISEGWLEKAHAQLMPPKTPKVAKRQVRYVPVDAAPGLPDVVALVKAVGATRTYTSKHTPDFKPPEDRQYMILTAAFCGLRIGELLALRGGDVSGDRLTISRQVQEVNRTQVENDPKNGKGREVIIPSSVIGYDLRKWLQERAVEVGKDGLLFPARRGGHWWRGRFYRSVWNPARDQAWGHRRWRLHDLRHFYARWLLDHGALITDVATMMGHSTMRVTMDTYIDQNAAVFDRVGDLVG